jgi:cell division protein FtsW (lipid II flippase)
VIILGLILLLIGYLLPVPTFVATLGWILLIIGLVLWLVGGLGHPIGGRTRWY